MSQAERKFILSDTPEPIARVPWLSLLPLRSTWAFILARFLTDPIWYVFLFWIPDFLSKKHGLRLQDFGAPLVVIYLIADAGSIAGGWISSVLIKRGWSVNKSRKTALFVCAAAVVPVIFASQTSNLWTAVLLIGLAAGAHQGWSANLFAMVSDVFPKSKVGSVVGISGTAGAVGGNVDRPPRRQNPRNNRQLCNRLSNSWFGIFDRIFPDTTAAPATRRGVCRKP